MGQTIWLLRRVLVVSVKKKKKNPADWLPGKQILQGNIWGKKFLPSKKYLSCSKKSYTVVSLGKKISISRGLGKNYYSHFLIRRRDRKKMNFCIYYHHLHSIIIFLGKAESGIYIKALPANSVKFGRDAKFACVAGTSMNGREREKRKRGKMHKDRILGPLGTWSWWTVICNYIWHWYHLSRHNITRHFRKFGNYWHGLFKLFIIQFIDNNIYFFMRKSSLHVLAENQPAIAQLGCWGKC